MFVMQTGKSYDVVAHIGENGSFSIREELSDHDKRIRNEVIEEILSYYKNNYEDAKRVENGGEPFSHWKTIIQRLEKMKGEQYHQGRIDQLVAFALWVETKLELHTLPQSAEDMILEFLREEQMKGEQKDKGCRIMREKEILDRVKVLFKAFIDMYEAQDKTPYVIGIQKSVAIWDGVECDANCLKEEMEDMIWQIDKLYEESEE